MMDFRFLFQDPSAEEGSYLLEAIAEAAEGVQAARGIFAFATANGVDLLFGEPTVLGALERARMQVVVGIDAVTDRRALERLQSLSRTCPNLVPRVFWNSNGGLFHPKLCYFEGAKRHTAIIGSGNLTPGGLRDNFEAFTIVQGSPTAMAAAKSAITSFLDRHQEQIRPIGPDELARAARNSGRETPRKLGKAAKTTPPQSASVSVFSQRVLVAEIPKGGKRWQQANFDEETIDVFFRAGTLDARTRRLLFLNEARSDGSLAENEIRPCVRTKSRSLRIELHALAGKEYPDVNRPLAVFREVKRRHFNYVVIFPGEPGYLGVATLLAEVQSQVRRRILKMDDLLAKWPSCPLGLPTPEDDE